MRKLKHKWVPASQLLSTETGSYLVCKRCGYVQNEMNKDKLCNYRKGKGGIAGILRDETKKPKA